jgi:myo-inositol-1(or 4)-monophosphatase
MQITRSALETDWLEACRRASERLREMLESSGEIASRAAETGTLGSGGDHTLVIDSRAESIVLTELGRLRERGYRFGAVSEELGEIRYDGDDPGDGSLVVIDPIDGSLNAKRGVPHHALSIAVASGSTMAEVEFGYVYDFGPAEEWWATLGGGAWRNGERLDPTLGEQRARDGRVEILGIESADPRWVAASVDALVGLAYRVRALGTIASTLCQVAAARFDAMTTLSSCRGVDAAAGQLIVREAGGLVSFVGFEQPLLAPLDVLPHAPLVAARSDRTLRELERLPRGQPLTARPARAEDGR